MNLKLSSDSIRFRLSEEEFRSLHDLGRIVERVVFRDKKSFEMSLELVDEDDGWVDLQAVGLCCHLPKKKYFHYAAGKMSRNDTIEISQSLDDGKFLGIFIEVDVFRR